MGFVAVIRLSSRGAILETFAVPTVYGPKFAILLRNIAIGYCTERRSSLHRPRSIDALDYAQHSMMAIATVVMFTRLFVVPVVKALNPSRRRHNARLHRRLGRRAWSPALSSGHGDRLRDAQFSRRARPIAHMEPVSQTQPEVYCEFCILGLVDAYSLTTQSTCHAGGPVVQDRNGKPVVRRGRKATGPETLG
jgi:hypothetical protein